MRARCFVALACAICTAGAFSCSDDGESQEMMPLNPQGGSGGSAMGNAGNAGSANGGSANGGSSNGGSGQGGSASPGNGGSANGGSGGSGTGGTMMAEAGSGGDMGGTGGSDGEPDAGPQDPPGDTVSFAEDLHQQIFVARCVGCHGSQWGSPTLATAYAAAVANADDIADRVQREGAGVMPQNCGQGPGTGNCLSVAQAELIQQWVDDDTPP